MALPIGELYGYPQEEYTDEGVRAVRSYVKPWGDRITHRQQLGLYPGNLYPYYTGYGLRVSRVGVEGWGNQGGAAGNIEMSSYEGALFTVEYKTPKITDPQPKPGAPFDIRKYCSERLTPHNETLPQNHELFRWNTALAGEQSGRDLTVSESPVYQFRRAKYSLTRYNLLSVPAQLLNLVGSINNATVTPVFITGITFPKHSLLFEPADVDASYDENNQIIFNVTYNFLYKEIDGSGNGGWRQYWRGDLTRANGNQFDKIVNKKSGLTVDVPPEADFSVVFP